MKKIIYLLTAWLLITALTTGCPAKTDEGRDGGSGAAAVVAAPVILPAAGTYFSSQNGITITCATSGASIYYTTDGTDPTESSTLYTGAVSVLTGTKTIKAKAFLTGNTPSSIISTTYAITFQQGSITNFSAVTTTGLTNNIPLVGLSGTPAASPCTLQGRSVYLSGFYIGKYELTYAQWYEVKTWAIANSYTLATAGMEGSVTGGGTYPEYINVGKAPSGTTQPVTMVGWRDCIVWCNALSEKLGLIPCYTYNGAVIKDATNKTACDNSVLTLTATGYRLPTEAEWEYAARGGYDMTPQDAPWTYTYAGSNTVSSVAVYNAASSSEVGSKTSNSAGLFDMSGNVYELCFDRYNMIGTSSEINPIGAYIGYNRTDHGGGWTTIYPDTCQVDFRESTNSMISDLGFTVDGLRIVRR